MRAARWFRESTAGQWDNFGPDAQREQQDRAIERYELVDAGLAWSVAASGWTSAQGHARREAFQQGLDLGGFRGDELVRSGVERKLEIVGGPPGVGPPWRRPKGGRRATMHTCR